MHRTGEIQVDQESVALIDRAEDPTQCPGAAKLLRCDEGVPSPQPGRAADACCELLRPSELDSPPISTDSSPYAFIGRLTWMDSLLRQKLFDLCFKLVNLLGIEAVALATYWCTVCSFYSKCCYSVGGLHLMEGLETQYCTHPNLQRPRKNEKTFNDIATTEPLLLIPILFLALYLMLGMDKAESLNVKVEYRLKLKVQYVAILCCVIVSSLRLSGGACVLSCVMQHPLPRPLPSNSNFAVACTSCCI